MKRKIFGFQYSMRKLWTVISAFLLLSMVLIFFILRYQQQTDLVQRTAQTQYESLRQFSDQLSNGFTQAENYLYSSFFGNEDISTMRNSSSMLQQYQTKQNLGDLLSRSVQLNEFVEASWFYQKSAQYSDEIFLSRNNYTGITMHEIKALKQWITEDLSDLSSSQLLAGTSWIVVPLEDTCYLIWATPLEDSFCGAWVSIPYLQALMMNRTLAVNDEVNEIGRPDGSSLVHMDSIISWTIPEDSSWINANLKRIQIGIQSEKGEFLLTKSIPCRNLLQVSSKIQPITILLVFFCAVISITVLTYQYLIYRPFQKFFHNLTTIRFLRTDSSNNRLPVDGHFSDIQILSTSINQLLDKNELLNQKVLDTEIRERDVQLQYLQVRLKAHFYMNGLSLIHAMARMGQNDLIQELSQCLIEYLRFIDVDTQKFVRLREELDHVRSYARIQELRFPNLFCYTEDVSAELYDASIPPLVLQTFVENAIEHGMRQGQSYQILVQAYYQERKEKPGMYFKIQDNGIGFSRESLQELAMKHYPIIENQNHGIGIKNVINRLRLLYEEEARITFGNAPEGGACITLWLPLLDLEEDPDEI